MTNPHPRNITHIGIVVPAHNEQELLPPCIAGLEAAASRVDVSVDVVIVLDTCTDLSRLAAEGMATLTVEARNVGAARSAGFAHVLNRRPRRTPVSSMWLATTDADSVVPSHWLAGQLDYAAGGAELVAGTVTVNDWDERPPAVRLAYTDHYSRPQRTDGHGHVHGANLGLAADVYLGLGGFDHLAAHEDAELIAAALRAGIAIAWAENLAVTTSARVIARAPAGFAGHLSQLEEASVS